MTSAPSRAALKEPAVLLVCDDPETSDRIEFLIEGTFGTKVIRATDRKQAVEKLRLTTLDPIPVRMVIFDVKKARFPEFEEFQKYFNDVTCVFTQTKAEGSVGTGLSNHGNSILILERRKLMFELKTVVGPLLAPIPPKEETVSINLADVEFCKIRTSLLLAVVPLKSDIYIRLSESKYLKLFREGDRFEPSDLEKYTVKKGIDYLFIKRNEIEDFLKKYTADLEKRAMQEPPVGFPDAARIGEAALETIGELGRRIGFTREVQVLAKTEVQMTLRAMGKSPSLKHILSRLHASGNKYIPSHSMLTAYVSCAIASHMEWGSEATFQKLTLASMLHDLTLENHELAEETHLTDVEASNKYTEVEKKAFKVHPTEASEIARKFTEVPPDVDVIIFQHHERSDGKGFPRGLNVQYMAPLACIFVVAHDLAAFCLKALNQGKAPNLLQFLNETASFYKGTQFKKCVSALEEVLQDQLLSALKK